jgi:hypothetical protein
MNEFVVFYAWQSDRLERLNKHLIRIALNLAAHNISADTKVGVRVRIDADTEGVLGHIPVTDTILKKIAACDAFVPDLTFVSVTDAGKPVCNPNVMLEYGYALHAKSHSVMMPVMNTAYGPAEKLPFDMGHLRHPIKYDLPKTAKNAERRTVRKMLTDEFEAILRLMVAARGEAKQTSLFQEAKASFSPAFFFPRGAVIAEFGHPGEQQYRFEGDKAIYLRLFPKFSEQPRVGRALLKAIVQNRRALNPMAAATAGGIAAPNDYGYVIVDASGSNTAQAISQGFATGEIWGINSNVFRSVALQHVTGEEKSIFFGAIGVEKAYMRTLENYASAALMEMKLRLPYMMEIGAVGLKGVYMGAPHPEFSSGNYYGPIRDETLIRRYELQAVTRSELDGVLRQFFNELYDLAECSRSEILTDEHVRRNDLPERG